MTKNIVFDETREAENVISGNFDKKINSYRLSLVAKYYRQQGLGFISIEKELIKLCYKYIGGFNEIIYANLIKYAVNSAKKYQLKQCLPVQITENEIKIIKSLTYEKAKILFVMLVLAKFDKFNIAKIKKNQLRETGYYANYSLCQIFKLANVHAGKKKRLQYIRELDLAGFISATKKGASNWHVIFAEDGIGANYVMNISEYDNLLKYLPPFCYACKMNMDNYIGHHRYCDDCYTQKRKNRNKKL